MEKELYLKDKYPVVSDDLKFDGKNIIMPSYYTGIICDYLSHVDAKGMNDADRNDYFAFVKFFEDVMDYKAEKRGH
jgi:hypothetical protein